MIDYRKNNRFILQNVRIGKNSRVRTRSFGSEPYLISIGDNCLITSGVTFVTHDGAIGVAYKFLQNKDLNETYGRYTKLGKIEVKDNCFIGINSIILPNVTIGPNSIVAAGSVVTKSVPPNTVVGGNPAKVITSIEEYSKKAIEQAIYTDEQDAEKRKMIFLEHVKKQAQIN